MKEDRDAVPDSPVALPEGAVRRLRELGEELAESAEDVLARIQKIEEIIRDYRAVLREIGARL
jgi:DNA-binding Lrp family transcriptional regulator